MSSTSHYSPSWEISALRVMKHQRIVTHKASIGVHQSSKSKADKGSRRPYTTMGYLQHDILFKYRIVFPIAGVCISHRSADNRSAADNTTFDKHMFVSEISLKSNSWSNIQAMLGKRKVSTLLTAKTKWLEKDKTQEETTMTTLAGSR